MQTVSVRAKPDALVRESKNGKYIPNDRFVSVVLTPSIQRSIERWGDLEVEPAPVAKPAPAPGKPAKPTE